MDQPGSIGVLLVQLGTPDAPTPGALRRYLREFLSDRRVIDLPRWQWLPILHLAVLPRRPARSAKLYARIWTLEGSPLLTTTKRQAALVEQALGGGTRVRVAVAMRYGEPSLAHVLGSLRDTVDRLLVWPLYPQYAGATTGSTVEAVFREIGGWRVVPAVRTPPPYFDRPEYIRPLADVARRSLASLSWTPDRYVISFHGLPRRYAESGDPYPAHCARTVEALTDAMGWRPGQVELTFQSRFGREEWLQPYTDVRLRHLAKDGARVAVMCPGFTADCLETLEEINITNREWFQHAGGRDYHYIPCLNDEPAWIEGLTALVRAELEGWS